MKILVLGYSVKNFRCWDALCFIAVGGAGLESISDIEFLDLIVWVCL